MGRSPTTQAKRQRELNLSERARDKAAARTERKLEKASRPEVDGDPDLVGIVAGPQPNPLDD